jgi:hypothetical protein
MAEDLGEEDIVGLVFGFELVATDGAVGASEVSWFQGRSREPKAAETYLGSCGPVVVLTALGEGKILRSRRVSRAWTSFWVGQNGDEVWLEAGAGSPPGGF